MPQPKFLVQPTDQVKDAIVAERAALSYLSTYDSEEFANNTEVMAFVTLNNSIESELANWPKFFSLDAEDDEDKTLRYCDVLWWRLIIRYTSGSNIIQVLYLTRLTEPKPSVADTISEMIANRPQAKRP